jgi:hypothetical protein
MYGVSPTSGLGNVPKRHAVLCGWHVPRFPKEKARAKISKPGKAAVNDMWWYALPGLMLYYTVLRESNYRAEMTSVEYWAFRVGRVPECPKILSACKSQNYPKQKTGAVPRGRPGEMSCPV